MAKSAMKLNENAKKRNWHWKIIHCKKCSYKTILCTRSFVHTVLLCQKSFILHPFKVCTIVSFASRSTAHFFTVTQSLHFWILVEKIMWWKNVECAAQMEPVLMTMTLFTFFYATAVQIPHNFFCHWIVLKLSS